jgi:Zn-dependent peptidase ImmA (M78 family)
MSTSNTSRGTKNPRQEARKILEELEITRPPVPVEKIARHLGAQLRFSPLDGEISGMIYIKDGVPIIGINSLHHPNRQRFTIAHECGHLLLHRPLITHEIHVDKKFPVLRRDDKSATGTEKIEIQANQFAAELTMPHVLLLAELGNNIVDIDDSALIERLAQQFKMSTDAMKIRVVNLFSSL